MTQQDYNQSIAPSQKLVQQWMNEFYGGPGVLVSSDELYLAKQAAQWGYQKRYLEELSVLGQEMQVDG